MSLPTLYTLAEEYRAAAERLADLDLPPEVVTDTLDGLAGELEVKATNVAMVIRNFESLAKQIKEAEEQMAARRKALEARAERIRDYLLTNMKRCGISQIESPWFRIAIRKNPASVVIDDIDAIPRDLFVYPKPPEPYPDKAAIKERLKNGEDIPGAHLEHGERIEIK